MNSRLLGAALAVSANAILATGIPGLAQASLVGDEILGTYGGFFSNSVATVTDPGVEFTGTDDFAGTLDSILTVDFTSNSLTVTWEHVHPDHGGHAFGTSASFTDLDWIGGPGMIVNVIQQGANTLPITNLAFGGDWISWDNSFAFSGTNQTLSATLDIVTSHVPLPAAVWLFGSGLLGLICVAKRKKA